MKIRNIFYFTLIASLLALSACEDQNRQSGSPQEAGTPAPVTGEAAQKPGGLKIYQVNPDGSSQEIMNVGTTSETAQPTGLSAVTNMKGIIITKDGFVPNTLTFKAGTKLIIQNEDEIAHWPASDPHPMHTDCPEFNIDKPLAKGEFFEVTITEPKICSIHDHLNPELKATITVTE